MNANIIILTIACIVMLGLVSVRAASLWNNKIGKIGN